MLKRITRISIMLMVSVILTAAMACMAEAATIASGTCGSKGTEAEITWRLDDNGEMFIQGTGQSVMADFRSSSDVPWKGYRSNIRWVEITGVSRIGNKALYSCDNLEGASLNASLTEIGEYAFAHCKKLHDLQLPYSLQVLEADAFRECTSLKKITIPSSVTQMGKSIVADCVNLEAFDCQAQIESMLSTCYNCKKLVDVTLPDTLITLGDSTFKLCKALQKIVIPNSVTKIEGGAFYDCSNLEQIRLPKNLTSIGNSAFEYCKKLETISFPQTLTHLGEKAFLNCKILKSAYFKGPAPLLMEYREDQLFQPFYTFEGCTVLYYVDGAAGWTHPSYKGYLTQQWDGQLEPKANDAIRVPFGKYCIHVVDENRQPIPDATVTLAKETLQTNQDGNAFFSNWNGANPQIRASKAGYLDWSNANLDWEKNEEQYDTVVLYTPGAGEYKLIQARYSHQRDLLFSVDLLSRTKKLDLGADDQVGGVSGISAAFLSCRAVCPEKVSKYQLWQKDWLVLESTDGFFDLRKGHFHEEEPCHVRVIAANGKKVDTYINLEIEKPSQLSASSFGLHGNQVVVKVDGDIPVIGNMEMKFEFPFQSNVLAECTTDGKIRLGLNVKDITGDKTTALNKTKKLINDAFAAGHIHPGSMGPEQTKLFESLAAEQKKCNLVRDCKASILGYFEGDLGSKALRGKLLIQIEADGIHCEKNMIIWSCPCTLQADLDFTAGANGEFAYELQSKETIGTVDLEMGAKLKLFGGAGVSTLVGAGVYGSGALDGIYRLIGAPMGLRSLDFTADLGLRAYLGPYEVEKSWAKRTWSLYTPQAGLQAASAEEAPFSIYDETEYHEQDLSYLEHESGWLGDQADSPELLASAAELRLRSLRSGTYCDARPSVAAAPDGIYIAYTLPEYRGGYSSIYVAKYDGASWSRTYEVKDDAVWASDPQLTVDESGTVYLAYSKTTRETSDLKDYLRNQKISLGVLDPQTLAYTEQFSADGNGPKFMDGESLMWLDSFYDQEDKALSPSSTSIFRAYLQDQGLYMVDEMTHRRIVDMAYNQDAMHVGYIVDDSVQNGQISNELLLVERAQAPGRVLDTNVSKVEYLQLPNRTVPCLVWTKEGVICSEDGTTIPAPGITNEFSVADNRIYYTANTENGSNVYMIQYLDGQYTEPIQITYEGDYLEDMTVVRFRGEDYVFGMHTKVTLKEKKEYEKDKLVDDRKSLVWGKILPISNLQLLEITYDREAMRTGQPLPVELLVKNVGDHAVASIDIEQDYRTIQTLSCNLAPGEEKLFSAVIDPQKKFDWLKMSVAETNCSDYYEEDNKGKVIVGQSNLVLDATYCQTGSTKCLQALITNNGVTANRGTVLFKNAQGKILSTATIFSIAPGETVYAEHILHSGDIGSGDCDYIVEVRNYKAELYADDNTEIIHVRPTPLESGVHEVAVEDNQMTITAANGENGACFAICAFYDTNDRLLSVNVEQIPEGVHSWNISNLPANGETLMVYLTDGQYRPVAAVYEENVSMRLP